MFSCQVVELFKGFKELRGAGLVRVGVALLEEVCYWVFEVSCLQMGCRTLSNLHSTVGLHAAMFLAMMIMG